MICVLAQYTSEKAKFPVKRPVIGLFVNLEMRVVKGPLFVDQDYVVEREIVALSESRRVETYWVRNSICDPASGEVVAETLLNQGFFKESYAEYPKERLR